MKVTRAWRPSIQAHCAASAPFVLTLVQATEEPGARTREGEKLSSEGAFVEALVESTLPVRIRDSCQGHELLSSTRQKLACVPPGEAAVARKLEQQHRAGNQDRRQGNPQQNRVDVRRLLHHRTGNTSWLLRANGFFLRGFGWLGGLRWLIGLRLSFEHGRPLEWVRCDT